MYALVPCPHFPCVHALTTTIAIYVNVKDVAVLHAAALLDPDVREKRIHAWATPFVWNDVLAIFRQCYPSRKFPEDLPAAEKLLIETDEGLARQLLKKWAQQDGWISLEQGIRETVDSRR